MTTKTSFLPRLISGLVLALLIILHVIPVPLLEVLVLYVVLNRPKWFKNLVDTIYGE